MNKELLQKYATLKQVIAEAETELDTLKPQVIEMIGDNDGLETEWGMFNITKRRVWEYPTPLVEREKQLKIDQKLSQQLGTAKYTEQPTLVYKKQNDNS